MVTFSEAQLMAWVAPIFWPFLRVLGVFASAPIFSARSVPVRTKIGLAFVIAVCLQPALPEPPLLSLNSAAAFGAVVQQLSIGLAIGLAVRIVFSAVEMAGEIVGLQMGLNFAGFFDPSTNAQTSTVGRFFGNTAMLLFIVLNGHLMLIQAVAASFQTFPVGEDAFGAVRTLRLHELGGLVFYYGLWIALPMIGMLLFVNVVMGIVSRIAPQMNVFAIGFPLTLSVGLLGIAFTLPMMDRPVTQLMRVIADLFGAG
ncbi:flagellar biosynthetic protein FliR [Aquabacterium sp. A08]|uniref:flagellar biosynthetic protein FliR n=1 Tax=Aquabacterium sp. A08 TaxID=2718532 RepID=UPI00141F61E1|nr:flagellar biosynthetic protein FliR [Aquabacterium sp. A08]NIC41939.1 flagellar biosynthetic protein FliR [Aquabacterium sp. A08]NIC41982.1 flagellar biosynthetic protein FliR [Aquabacterium sp. A08]